MMKKQFWIGIFILSLPCISCKNKVAKNPSVEPVVKLQYYAEPRWPVESYDNETLRTAILLFKNNEVEKAKKYIKNNVEESLLASYWIAEMHANLGQPDSVLLYTSKFVTINQLNDKANTLKAGALIAKGRTEEAKMIIKYLPKSYQKRFAGLK